MPFINRMRLVNVHFNKAKQFYEDFRLDFNADSTTYQLLNGGGKSVLLMMLMQTVIPGQHLKPEKPVKDIFVGGPDRTSHVLVEWELDEGHLYKYMATGFCARKAHGTDEEDIERLGMEYFNYVYFYNDENSNDIYHLPIFKVEEGKKYIASFSELKKILNMLKTSTTVETFNTKAEYKDFLSGYQIHEAEWMLMKNVNIRENNLANFLREQKSSRTLVENFIVDIIDKALHRSEKISSKEMTETVLAMKENIQKLKKLYTNIEEIEAYKTGLTKIMSVNDTLKESYGQIDVIAQKMVSLIKILDEKLESKQNEHIDAMRQSHNYKAEYFTNEQILNNLRICKSLLVIDEAQGKYEQQKIRVEDLQKKVEDIDKEIKKMESVNKTITIASKEDVISQNNAIIEKSKMENEEVVRQRQQYGKMLYPMLLLRIKATSENLEDNRKSLTKYTIKETTLKREMSDLNERIGGARQQRKDLENELSKHLKESDSIRDALSLEDISIFLPDEVDTHIERVSDTFLNAQTRQSTLIQEKNELEKQIQEQEIQLAKLTQQVEYAEKRESELSQDVKDYRARYIEIERLKSLYASSSCETLTHRLSTIVEENKHNTLRLNEEIILNNRYIDIIDTHGVFVEEQKIVEIEAALKQHYSFVQLGIHYLKDMDDSERKHKIERFPLLPHAILLYGDDFHNLKKNPSRLNKFTGIFVPIINLDSIRKDSPLGDGNLLFPLKDNAFMLDSINDVAAAKSKLEKEIDIARQKIEKADNESRELNRYIDTVKFFINSFGDESATKLNQEYSLIVDQLNGLREKQQAEHEAKNNNQTKHANYRKEIMELDKDIETVNRTHDLLLEFKEINNSIDETSNRLFKTKENLKSYEDQKETLVNDESLVIKEKNNLIEIVRHAESSQKRDSEDLIRIDEFKNSDYIPSAEDSIDDVKARYAEFEKDNSQSLSTIKLLQDANAQNTKDVEQLKREIQKNGFSYEQLKNIGYTEEYSLHSINEQESHKKIAEAKLAEESARRNKLYEHMTKMQGSYEQLKATYEKEYEPFVAHSKSSNNQELQNLIQKHEFLKADINKKQDDNNQRIESLVSAIKIITDELTKLRTFKEAAKITLVSEESISLSDELTFDKIKSDYDRQSKVCADNKKELKKEIDALVKKTKTFKAYSYGEILETMELPNSSHEALKIGDMLTSHMGYLADKERLVRHDYENNSKERDSFIASLVGLGEIVYAHLMRMNSLSKIKISDSIKKEMVRIELDMFEEDVRFNNMKQHIDNLIERIEKENMTKDDIASELSSKVFLSQIADTKKAKVSLYKAEEIHENSDYVRWEKAVESDGQTNVLYFMFLATIISFIRNLSRSTEDFDNLTSSKKVIVLDNPFGTTSAIYLWNLVLEMLKQNNIQLIASGHKISGSILAMFKTNYKFIHKFFSGGIQKVVIDQMGQAAGKRITDEILVDQATFFDE